MLRILMVDDDEEEYLLLKDLLARELKQQSRRSSMTLDWVGNFDAALEALAACSYDVYLVDYRLGGRSGIDLLRTAQARACRSPIILLTGQGSYDVDLAAMSAGAADYLVKDQISFPLLERALRYALERKQTEAVLERLVQERTRSLAQTVADLQTEIGARIQTESALRITEQALRQTNDRLEAIVAERTAQLQRRAEELRALQTATASLLHTLDLQALLDQILDSARQAVPAAGWGGLCLLEGEALPGYLPAEAFAGEQVCLLPAGQAQTLRDLLAQPRLHRQLDGQVELRAWLADHGAGEMQAV
ncbi:MAG: response regulator, partial [Chloroflexota bacterium]